MKYLLPMARNTVTGETIKTQDLNGVHFQSHQKQFAKVVADRVATEHSQRTGQHWVGFLKEYTPGKNPYKSSK
jgi:hypothetical protein